MCRAATRFALASGTGVVKAQADDRDDAYWQAAMPGLRLRYAEHLSAIHEELRDLEIPLLLVRYPSHLSMIDPTVLFNHGDCSERFRPTSAFPSWTSPPCSPVRASRWRSSISSRGMATRGRSGMISLA
jgi:hypothetical protein